MRPRIVELPAMDLWGESIQLSPSDVHRIAELWARFGARLGSPAGYEHAVCYGVCANAIGGSRPAGMGMPTEGGWRYTAAVHLPRHANSQRAFDVEARAAGLEALHLPAQRYAEFTYRGPVVGIGGAFAAVFGEWLPAAGLAPIDRPQLERYAGRWDPAADTNEMDILVPV